MGLFAETRVRIGLSTPVLEQYDYLALSVRDIPERQRLQTIHRSIRRADLVVIVIGTYTFQKPWAYDAIVYAVKEDKALGCIDQTNIYDGWSSEITTGPSPLTYTKWAIHEGKLALYTLNPYLDVLWTKRLTVPHNAVHYRFPSQTGLLGDIFPCYDWVFENGARNLPQWIATWLHNAGKS